MLRSPVRAHIAALTLFLIAGALSGGCSIVNDYSRINREAGTGADAGDLNAGDAGAADEGDASADPGSDAGAADARNGGAADASAEVGAPDAGSEAGAADSSSGAGGAFPDR